MTTPSEFLDLAFRHAHTANKFKDQPVGDALLHELYELAKWGPTSLNCQPMRLVFVRSAEGKQRLKQALMPGNVDKTMAAPVLVIVATDKRFYEQLPTQFPAVPGARDMMAGNAALAQSTGFRNGSLQGAYLMLAARMLGLAVGPMSGFDPAKLNAAFFPSGDWEANFLFNLGYGDDTGNRPRGPRLDFDAVARFA
jgi:3-hydroxypropanoate dehydrogenase